MPRDFLPSKDAELLSWATNFSAKISPGPIYGLSAAQATAFAALLASFSSALSVATTPATRTKGTIAAKNTARTPLKANARQLARIVQATPTVTPQQKIDLGLRPRDVVPSPVNPPTEPPVLEVVSAFGRTLKLKLRGVDTEGRGKPDGCDGAYLYSLVGATPSADIGAWKFEGGTTRNSFDVEFPATVPAGSQVWLTAQWFNPRNQTGPACTPISAFIAGGVTQAQQAA